MAELIQKTDTLNEGREKLNEAIKDAEKAKIDSSEALDTANTALSKSESTQTQLDNIVVDGDSSVEAAQARVDKSGRTYGTLKERLDTEHGKVTSQLADTDDHRHFESMINRKEPGLLASWVDDDGNHLFYPRFKPIIEEYGIPMTSALITSRMDVSDRISPEQRDELEELGVEFISHTHYHDVDRRPLEMTEEELEYDFKTSKKIMREYGYNHRGLVLPFGDNSDLIQKVARRHFDYVIGTGAQRQGFPQYPGKLDNYYIWRVTVESGFEFVKKQLDEAADRGVGWVVFVSHAFGEWYSEDYVRQIIEYALSKGFEFVTTQEGIDRMGNTAQFGDSKITAEGQFIGGLSIAASNSSSDNPVTNDTSIRHFAENTITHTRIDSYQIDGFPGGVLSGVLVTYRYNNDLYSFQEFITTRTKRYYVRYWNTDTNSWDGWIPLDSTNFLGVNSITVDDIPTNPLLALGKTYTYIDSYANSRFPESRSGMLVTYAFRTSDWPFQEYHIYQSNKVYKRYYDGNNWSEWSLITTDEFVTFRKETNSVTNQTPGSEFETGITIVYINSQGNRVGLPNESTGIIKTTKLGDFVGRTYQEFKEFNTFNKYIRYEKSGGGWSEWKKFVLE